MKYILTFIAGFIVILAISWLATCGIVKLITLCFGLTFTWAIGTGIWLVLFLLGTVFGGSKK